MLKKKNTVSVVKKKEGVETVLKKGTPKDHTRIKEPNLEPRGKRVGASVGCTLNMDNYESMRIDVWFSDDVQEGETVEKAFKRVRDLLDNQIQNAVDYYTKKG